MDEHEHEHNEDCELPSDRQVAIHALMLFATTCEVFIEGDCPHPVFYKGLDLAISMADYLDEDELVVLLKSIQIAMGEGIEQKKKEFMDEINERLSKLDFEAEQQYNPSEITSSEEQ